jgi:amino acid transporter
MNVRGPRVVKWSPLTILAVVVLVVVVLYLAPLQGLLVVGIWLICPLLMIGMHVSGRHHGSHH